MAQTDDFEQSANSLIQDRARLELSSLPPDIGALQEFHRAYKFLLLEHHPTIYRAAIAELIRRYQAGSVPFTEPLSLIHRLARKLKISYLEDQRLFSAYPPSEDARPPESEWVRS